MRKTALSPFGFPQPFTGEVPTIMGSMTFKTYLAGSVLPAFDPPLPTQRCQVNDPVIEAVVEILGSDGEPVNLRLATSVVLEFRAPSGRLLSQEVPWLTNGLDGKVEFEAGLVPPFDEVGVWFVQAVVTSGGEEIRTSVGKFYVRANA